MVLTPEGVKIQKILIQLVTWWQILISPGNLWCFCFHLNLVNRRFIGTKGFMGICVALGIGLSTRIRTTNGLASRTNFLTATWRRGNEDPSCTESKWCKTLIFGQCRSPAFHNLQIYFRSFNDVLSTRFPTSKSKLRNSTSINTLRNYLGNQVHVFLIQVTERCVSVISTGFGAHC